MRLGVFLLAGRFPGQSDQDALLRSLDAVVWAEQAGFDDVWMAEHHFMSYGVCPSAITFAALALGRTERITVGTAVSVLSTTHPVQLAEQVTMLDQMSGGRFHLGVGRGGPWRDLEVFGTGVDRWQNGFADSLDVLLDCLAKPAVGSTGRSRSLLTMHRNPKASPALARNWCQVQAGMLTRSCGPTSRTSWPTRHWPWPRRIMTACACSCRSRVE